jgi:hypothetical protein
MNTRAKAAQALRQYGHEDVARRIEAEGSGGQMILRQGADWPEPPADEAYHGVAGRIVQAVESHTEADPVALLGSVLAIFGVLAGRQVVFYQGSQQATNLYVALVGESSTGRKGTALSLARAVFDAAAPGWDSTLVPGLGSGEGLINRLNDGDPRALVLETEMGRLLRVMAREGSTLSPTIRDAWDGVPLGRFLSREEALVLRHHVGLLAHVTPPELRERLTEVDAANGFGNRFLWLAVRRTRLVPFPEAPGALVSPYITALRGAISDAQQPGEARFSPQAAWRWEQFYASLAEHRRVGLAGALTARAEAQVARLALVYALLDRSRVVEVDHLAAAEALWGYAERSVRYVFGDSTGNRDADYIRRLLAEIGPAGKEELRRETGIREGARLQAAIDLLRGLDLVVVTKGEAGSRGGRRPDVVALR